MNPTIMTARVTDQRLQLVNEPLIASGGVDVVQVRFEFCGLWDGCGKSAVFYRDPENVYHIPIVDNLATIPHEMLTDEGYFYLGVMGVKSNTRTTEVVRVRVSRGAITTATAEPEEPTPDVYQQLLAAYGVERARLDELVASKGAGWIGQYPIDETYISGSITSSGAAAFIDAQVTGLSLAAGKYWVSMACIPPEWAPFFTVALDVYVDGFDLSVGVQTLEDSGWGRFYIRNVGTQALSPDAECLVYGVYPLTTMTIPELTDARVRANGTVCASAGAALRLIDGEARDTRNRLTVAEGVLTGVTDDLRAVESELSQLKAENANIGDAQGFLVQLDDVSATEHELAVTVFASGDPTAVTLHRCGRNLLPIPAEYYHHTHANYKPDIGYTNAGVTFKVQDDGGIVVNGTATGSAKFHLLRDTQLPVGDYVLSCVGATPARGMSATITRADGSKTYITPSTAQTFTLGQGDVVTLLSVCVEKDEVVENYELYPMLEFGTVAGSWESSAGNTSHTPQLNREVYGVMSVYPVTTLYTTTPSTLIKCEYERDSNATLRAVVEELAELKTRLAALETALAST